MKKILVLGFFTFLINYTFAQHEGSVFTATGRAGVSTTFATDYQSLGINPANLGFPAYEGRKSTMGYSETGVSVFSSALTKSELRQSITNFVDTNFTYEQKLDAVSKFAGEPFSLNFDGTYFGYSFQHDKIGGFAICIKEKFNWYSNLNAQVTNLAFLGYSAPYFDSLLLNDGTTVSNSSGNYYAYKDQISKGISAAPQMISQLFDGSKINMLWYREYNIGYGRKILGLGDLELLGGVGVKYLQGFAIMDAKVENGKLEAFGAFTPKLNIDFGAAALTNPSTITQSSFLPKPIGSGWGFDIGANLVFKENTKLAIAITDIGSVKYTGNVYEIKDTLLIDINTEGFNSYNFFMEMSKIAGESGIFKWKGEKEITAALPTTVRIGASQKFFKVLEIGADIIAPVTAGAGNFDKALFSVGADLLLFNKIRLSSGFITGGNYGTKKNIPVGITVIAPGGVWEGGIASRDAVTYFTQESPNLSLAFGFLRFRF